MTRRSSGDDVEAARVKRQPAPSIFADEFECVGLRHTRGEKPTCALVPQKNITMTLPLDLGRATLTYYSHGATLYARVVSMQAGEVAWFTVALVQP